MTYCCYCEFDIATDRDHVIPKSYSGSQSFAGTVPACKECNALLSNSPNHNMHDRTTYLYEAYYKKYKKLLNGAEWTAKEIKQLKGQLKAHVVAQEKQRVAVNQKLLNIRKTVKTSLYYD
jgi:hypothetical protein